ncbi:MAG: hypothetical protein GFH27_549289n85 [Chloroflexi bacterium AL-W]|nr:hypothetical protein [Chloroflexi bacterium AL-N1]NOK66817.1 hypothetical protein [Chloroflexi bacterium AL-N10]NOK74891.1 hypothetical protein [Chloroflexi bacterium AL-N5]NOK81420.1 hypothetical protein [Chloroflexi bacterium AL-W]NOK88889.1 hypothetical protein [Chloroflexi bacterium AL-N15]
MELPDHLDRPNLFTDLPTPPVPQQERSRKRREALLTAALEAFTHHGFDATTIEGIARAAGASVGSFYQYFHSKQQLLLVLMEHFLEEIDALDLTLTVEEDIRPQIQTIVHQALGVDAHYAGVYRAWREAIRGDTALARLDQHVQDWTASRLIQLVEGLAHLPGARKHINRHAIASMVNILFWELIARTDTLDLDTTIQSVTDLIYHTLFEDT